MGRENVLVHRLEPRRDDFQEVLEHVVRLFSVCFHAVQRVLDAQAAFQALCLNCVATDGFLFRSEIEAVDNVSKIVMVPALEVWH